MLRWHVMIAASPRARGFTLLELLLVLVLIAGAAGLVAPQLLRWMDAARERSALADLHAAFANLPQKAFFAGRAIEIRTTPAPTLQGSSAGAELLLPSGWQLRTTTPIRYEANGMTLGGTVDILMPGRPPRRWSILPPAGQVRDDHGTAPR